MSSTNRKERTGVSSGWMWVCYWCLREEPVGDAPRVRLEEATLPEHWLLGVHRRIYCGAVCKSKAGASRVGNSN